MMMSTMRVVTVALATTSFNICHGFTGSNSRREDRVVESLMSFEMMSRKASSPSNKPSSMFEMLQNNNPATAFQQIFGEQGYRGEYMDGYSQAAMIERCIDDYNWSLPSSSAVEEERIEMMTHLYDNPQLWENTCMVAFAEHYLTSKAYETFQRQKKIQQRQSNTDPIFGGVLWDTWQQDDDQQFPALYKEKGIDYVRLHCNFGDDGYSIGGAAQLTPNNRPQFGTLARAAKECQENEMVPLLLLQLPWREIDSIDYFHQAMNSLASELHTAGVNCEQLILETRPPIGISALLEEELKGTARQELGFQTGETMFQAIHNAFFQEYNTTIAGFCVAGGSTKGKFPTAMQDDTQNAVRQGIRLCALEEWGYDMCFWEMGAKLMLQPEVGRLWGQQKGGGRDAARGVFCLNARNMADEIKDVKMFQEVFGLNDLSKRGDREPDYFQ